MPGFDLELEQALALSRGDLEMQQVLELSKSQSTAPLHNGMAMDEDEELRLALERSKAESGDQHNGDATSTNWVKPGNHDGDDELQQALKRSLEDCKPAAKASNKGAVVDLLDGDDEDISSMPTAKKQKSTSDEAIEIIDTDDEGDTKEGDKGTPDEPASSEDKRKLAAEAAERRFKETET